MLATGGAGQLFAVTTNPAEATADGLAMALRAGVPVADVEFMQFHPTALHHPAMPRPLLSEALRGHGALLRDADGGRFVDELAPRDVVSRAMAERMRLQGVESLWLDATALDAFDARFPTIAASLRAIGLDPTRDWLPIAPAAHYLSGGVITDLSGATALPGLWAAGEVACTGVHGANRLASNSLLEGMVFGARLAESILAGDEGASATGVLGAYLDGGGEPVDPTVAAPWSTAPRPDELAGADSWADVPKTRELLQRSMTEGAGVVRSAESLAGAGRLRRRHRRRRREGHADRSGRRRAGQPGHRGAQPLVGRGRPVREPAAPTPGATTPSRSTDGAAASPMWGTGWSCSAGSRPSTRPRPVGSTGRAGVDRAAHRPHPAGGPDPVRPAPWPRWSRRCRGRWPRTSCPWGTSRRG